MVKIQAVERMKVGFKIQNAGTFSANYWMKVLTMMT